MNKDAIVALLSPHIRFAAAETHLDNIAAHCPFHKGGKEKTPSFFVYVGPPRYNKSPGSAFCHTCNRGWSLVSLLKSLGVGSKYIDTLVSEMYECRPVKQERKLSFDLPRLPEAILGAFDFIPKTMLQEGFTRDTLDSFDIGFDRRSKRITFPIRDHLGNLVGVSGRTVVNALPRYKIYRKEFDPIISNYSLNKGRLLWNLDSFYHYALNTSIDKPVIITEGFKAAMWVWQCGHPYTVALMGTHLSEEQIYLLTSITGEVVLFLDDDQAGRDSTKKLEKLLSKQLLVRVAEYPRPDMQESPDDLSVDEVIAAVKNAKSKVHRHVSKLERL